MASPKNTKFKRKRKMYLVTAIQWVELRVAKSASPPQFGSGSSNISQFPLANKCGSGLIFVSTPIPGYTKFASMFTQ